jgi:hypothetical protein
MLAIQKKLRYQIVKEQFSPALSKQRLEERQFY